MVVQQSDAMTSYDHALQRGTALITACQRGHLDVVKALLAHGAHVNFGDDKVRSVMYCYVPSSTREDACCVHSKLSVLWSHATVLCICHCVTPAVSYMLQQTS